MTISIGLCGATGKVGQMIISKIQSFNSCTISATFSSANNLDDLAKFCQDSQIIIDFSSTKILNKLLDYSIMYNNKLVIGTTGLTKDQFDRINEASQNIAILYSANMSLTANLLAMLTEKAAKILDNSYDVEIIEYHHRMKKDAPSGTALMLGKTVANARNVTFNEYTVFNRNEQGQRNLNEIGISSIRGGAIQGEHEVLFLGDNETLRLKHQSLSRESYAIGALQAAIWLSDKIPGLYSMRDMLQL